jgi:hypothetical protein
MHLQKPNFTRAAGFRVVTDEHAMPQAKVHGMRWGEYWMGVYAISTIASTGPLPQFPDFLPWKPEGFRSAIGAANVAQAPRLRALCGGRSTL